MSALGRIRNTAAGSSKNNDLHGRRWQLFKTAKRLFPELKSLQCCHSKMATPDAVVTVRGGGDVPAFFGGTYRCGSVWMCPHCARRIASRRREELNHAIERALQARWSVHLQTLTAPHQLDTPVADQLSAFSDARRRLTSYRGYKALLQRFEVIGEVRSIEVTYGKNGWHPHSHSILFSQRQQWTEADRAEFRRELWQQWRRACRAAGLADPTEAHGVDVRSGNAAANYATKWGMADELAKPKLKQGVDGSRTPWQLLADAADGDKRAAWLWREYAIAFKGRRQLFWSRKLRAALELEEELPDQQAAELDPPTEFFIVLDDDTWHAVKVQNAESYILQAADISPGRAAAALDEVRQTYIDCHGRQRLGRKYTLTEAERVEDEWSR